MVNPARRISGTARIEENKSVLAMEFEEEDQDRS